jgi:sulfur relay protein TusB/DsrH
MLHLVSGSSNLAAALAACAAGDDLVLVHAAVLAATQSFAFPPGVGVQAMGVDLAARGLDAAALAPGIGVLDDAGLVALSLRHPQSLTWT